MYFIDENFEISKMPVEDFEVENNSLHFFLDDDNLTIRKESLFYFDPSVKVERLERYAYKNLVVSGVGKIILNFNNKNINVYQMSNNSVKINKESLLGYSTGFEIDDYHDYTVLSGTGYFILATDGKLSVINNDSHSYIRKPSIVMIEDNIEEIMINRDDVLNPSTLIDISFKKYTGKGKIFYQSGIVNNIENDYKNIAKKIKDDFMRAAR